MLNWKPWLQPKLVMSCRLAHHPTGDMGQRPIELVYDEDLRALETLMSNNNGRLATPRVKWVEDPTSGVVIPGSMSLLRQARAKAISRQPSGSPSSTTDGACCSCAPASSSSVCRSRAASSPSKAR